MYHVEIANEDALLDEQKPIGEQPAEVLQGLRRVVGSLSANELETFFRRIGYRESEDGKEQGEGAAETYFHDEDAMQNRTGRDFYRALAAAYKSDRSASQTLNAYGIKGIAYGGRQDGRCCVVFDDKAIEILEKFSAKGEGAKLRQMLAAAQFLKADDLTAEERNLPALGEEMGTPVVWMDGDASLHGFHSGGVTFLNRRSEMCLPQVFWHESFHYMRANNPALYGEMVRHIERAEHITKEQMDAYREKIGRPSLSDADVIEEMLADRMQDVKERVRLLKGMGRENAGLAARIAAWIRRMIDRFVAHFSRAGDRLSERQTAAMAEAFSRVMHDMKDGEGKPLFRVRGKSVRMADGRELPALDAKEQTADEKLKADAKAWKQTLKEAWEGNMPESQMLKVMETPLALQLAGAKPLPLYMRQSKLMKIRGKHPEMTKAVLSELPKHLADPMIVFKSATKPGRIVVGLSLLDADGINVVVPVELDAGKAHTEINVVLSTYGKGSTSHGVNYGWFSRNIHTGNTLYVNKKQVADLYQSAGLQLPMEGRRFNDLFGSSIKTDADLVKMRAANRSKYSASMQPPTPQKEGNENETNAIKYSASLDNEPAGSASRIRRVLDGVKNGTRPIGGVAVRDYRGTSSVTVGKGQEARFMRDRGLTAKDIVEREELDGGKVRLRYRMKGLGPLGQLHTPRFLARTNPKIKAIYDLGEKAMHTQERLRNQFNKPVREFARLTKREEDLQEVTSVLLQGDAEDAKPCLQAPKRGADAGAHAHGAGQKERASGLQGIALDRRGGRAVRAGFGRRERASHVARSQDV